MEYPKKWQNIDAMGDKTCQIICQTEIARGKHLVHMFPPYIFTMSRSTPDQKSRREVRRRLVDLYSSNLLSMSANLPSPDHLLWPLDGGAACRSHERAAFPLLPNLHPQTGAGNGRLVPGLLFGAVFAPFLFPKPCCKQSVAI